MSCNCSRHLGNMAMIFDIIPTRLRPKLSTVEAGTAEFDYMLATLVFDLAKKHALLNTALREFLLHADPHVARKIIGDSEQLEALGQDYTELAHATEELMLRAVAESIEDHETLARLVVRWNDEAADASA